MNNPIVTEEMMWDARREAFVTCSTSLLKRWCTGKARTFAAVVTCFILMGCLNFEPIGPCFQVDCSGHGQCHLATDGIRAICQCDEGYVSDGLSCHEEQGLAGEILLCQAMAALLREGEVVCAGVLIAPEWVLTTNDCASRTESVAFPSQKVITIPAASVLTVDQVIPSEDYQLALLHLESPSRNVPAVLGSDRNGASLEGHTLIMTGWGKEDDNLWGRPSIGSSAALQDPSQCPSLAAPDGEEVCLRVTAGQNGVSCYGQQGSPLWIDDLPTTELAALAGASSCPADNDSHTLAFILLSPYLEWLRANVTGLESIRDDVDGSEQCAAAYVDETTWRMIDDRLEELMQFSNPLNCGEPIVVPVYFNVLFSGREGNVSHDQIDIQIDVLNDAFSGRWGGFDTGIRFIQAGFLRYEHENWFRISHNFGEPHQLEIDLKGKLRQGMLNALNIYTAEVLGNSSTDLLGWATYPWNVPDSLSLDGVVVDYRSLPEGDIAGYDEGLNVVHQVGHWLGLLHPHSSDCSDADFMSDTPTQNGPSLGCPLWRDTCEGGGPDAIHNFMSFSHDHCRVEFTAEQGAHMQRHYGFRCSDVGALEWNIDRPGYNYRVISPFRKGAEGCFRECLADEQCRAYTYTPQGFSDREHAICWLKDLVPGRTYLPSVASGVVRGGDEHDVDRPGMDYKNFFLSEPTWETCRDECIADSVCNSFTYTPPDDEGNNARCWLKHASPWPYLGAIGLVSGIIREDGLELNVTRTGTPLISFEITPPDAHVCQRACAGEDDCRAFVHTMASGGNTAECVLMADIGVPRAASSAISGVVH